MKTSFYKQGSFLGSIHRNATRAVKATSRARYNMLADPAGRPGLISGLLSAAEENGGVGAASLNKTLGYINRRVSDADTYLGAIAAGRKWKNPDRLRSSLFVSRKTNFNPDSRTLYKARTGGGYSKINTKKDGRIGYETPLPSITAPVKALAPLLVAGTAIPASMKKMDEARGVQRIRE